MPLAQRGKAPRPLKIHFEYKLDPEVPLSVAAYLKNQLLPATEAVLRQFIQVRSMLLIGVRQ
jgi:hypothetical protein